ncbi:MAG: hypothetical protein M1524_01365 [Patescibacteria group bacterium]|nr:hypothetical protein [Patescibacteria group bacterium]
MEENLAVQESGLFFGIKKKYLILIAAFLLILISVFAGSLIVKSIKEEKTSVPGISSPKTWEIIVSFDTGSQKLTLNKISVLDREIVADYTGAKLSPYELMAVNDKGDIVYKTKVNITEQLFYDILDVDSDIPSPPKKLDTILYIPYQKTAVKIRITKNSETILEIMLPTKTSFKIIPGVFAASSTCRKLTTVFLSDGYTDFNQYRSDVRRLIDAFESMPPYSSKPGIFDFKIIENRESLGCLNGIFRCITNPKIQQISRASYPNASKFIVVVNNPNAAAVDGNALGVANSPGGDTAIFTNRTDLDSLVPNLFTKVAVHEFLGHIVGILYDRYIYPSTSPLSSLTYAPFGITNCTTLDSVPVFWNVTQIYQGCTSRNLYAPSPLTCADGPANGTPESVMSAAKCAGYNFDRVEQTWIRDYVLTDYDDQCGGSPPVISDIPTPSATETPTPTPSPSPTITPTPTGAGTSPTGDLACTVVHEVETSSTCDYDEVNKYTDWCRTGEWHCDSTKEVDDKGLLKKYTVNSWCEPNTRCSTKPEDGGPKVCVECDAGENLINYIASEEEASIGNEAGVYCRRFKGNCESDCSKCKTEDLLTHWVENNYAYNCHSCSSPGPGPDGDPTGTPTDVTPTEIPSPTPVLYSCVFDPNCKSGGSTMSICQLICSEK